jgi:glycosyltransferase involved in cell wall biosynthesis
MYAAKSKPAYITAAIRAATQLKPRLVIAGHIGVAPVATALKKAGLAESVGVILHGIEAWRRCDWTDRLAARHADAVIATTRFTAEEFARLNDLNIGRAMVIPLAVGQSEIPMRLASTSGRQVRVLTVGRLVSSDEYKGIDTLINAMSLLKQHTPPVTLDIVGHGDDMERLREISRQCGVCNLVRFHGSVNDEMLEQLYTRCDIFALPSRAEGFGIVFLEAMRHGKPCIGGNHGGIPEVIDHEKNGFLVEHGDVAALSTAISRLAVSGDLRAEWGLNGQRKVASKYLFPTFEANWHRAFESLISRT